MARRRDRPHNISAIRLGRRAVRRTETAIEALVVKYVRAEAELRGMITTGILSGDFESLVYRQRVGQQVDRVLRILHEAAVPRARELVAQSYEAGVRVAGEQGHSTIKWEAIDLLQENLDERLTSAERTVGRRAKDIFRREALRAAAMGIGREGDRTVLIRDMVKRLQKEGTTSFVDKSGKEWGLERYAQMAIRTVTTEAQTLGTSHTLMARGFDLVEVSNSSEGGPCKICAPYVGKTFSLTGRSDAYPVLEPSPPFHGQCNCFITASPLAAAERLASGVLQ